MGASCLRGSWWPAILLALAGCTGTPGLHGRLLHLADAFDLPGRWCRDELDRARNLGPRAASFIDVGAYSGLASLTGRIGPYFWREMTRPPAGLAVAASFLPTESGRGSVLFGPGSAARNLMGGELHRSRTFFPALGLLVDQEWMHRLARDPRRETVERKGEGQTLPAPLSLGRAFLLALPVW